MPLHSKLSKLTKKAWDQGHFSVATASAHLLADTSDINRQINLVGALHEVGYLQSSLAPYWKEFREDERAWIEICLSRLALRDHDYWALAGLLGCHGSIIVDIALGRGFKSAAVRRYPRYDKPDVHVHTLYLDKTGKMLSPILEIGYDAKNFSAVDVGRARALSLDNNDWEPGQFTGDGWLSLSMQAKLPHGAWRTPNVKFEITEECLISPHCEKQHTTPTVIS